MMIQETSVPHASQGVKKIPGARRPRAWKPRKACPWAVGAARTEPLPVVSERPLSQVVISSGMLCIRLREEKNSRVSVSGEAAARQPLKE